MGAFGQVIPVVGTPFGFVGEPSRSGGGDPFITVRQANVLNANNINFGDFVVLLPDATGGTVKQFQDWQANGGLPAASYNQNVNFNNASPIITPANIAGLALGMFAFSSGNIPAGTYITAINPVNGQVTLSKTPTGSNNASAPFQFAMFLGVAVREVKTMLAYTITPGSPIPANASIGSYAPGQYVGILSRGSISVKNLVGAPVAGGPVYMRAILNGGIPAGLVGDVEANNDGNNNILLAGNPAIAEAFFKNGVVDANNVTEIVLTIRAGV